MSFNLRVINDAGLGILAEATSGHSVILDYAYAWPNAPSYSESQLKNSNFEPGLPGYIVSRKITISGTDTSTNTARIVAAFDVQASEVRANLIIVYAHTDVNPAVRKLAVLHDNQGGYLEIFQQSSDVNPQALIAIHIALANGAGITATSSEATYLLQADRNNFVSAHAFGSSTSPAPDQSIYGVKYWENEQFYYEGMSFPNSANACILSDGFTGIIVRTSEDQEMETAFSVQNGNSGNELFSVGDGVKFDSLSALSGATIALNSPIVSANSSATIGTSYQPINTIYTDDLRVDTCGCDILTSNEESEIHVEADIIPGGNDLGSNEYPWAHVYAENIQSNDVNMLRGVAISSFRCNGSITCRDLNVQNTLSLDNIQAVSINAGAVGATTFSGMLLQSFNDSTHAPEKGSFCMICVESISNISDPYQKWPGDVIRTSSSITIKMMEYRAGNEDDDGFTSVGSNLLGDFKLLSGIERRAGVNKKMFALAIRIA